MNDLQIARRYVSKADNAEKTGIPFELSFTSFKNLMSAKKCGYIGIPLTTPRPGKGIRATDRTIDRIDNSQGYVKGNVIAVCNAANQFKSIIEAPNSPITWEAVKRMISKLDK